MQTDKHSQQHCWCCADEACTPPPSYNVGPLHAAPRHNQILAKATLLYYQHALPSAHYCFRLVLPATIGHTSAVIKQKVTPCLGPTGHLHSDQALISRGHCRLRLCGWWCPLTVLAAGACGSAAAQLVLSTEHKPHTCCPAKLVMRLLLQSRRRCLHNSPAQASTW